MNKLWITATLFTILFLTSCGFGQTCLGIVCSDGYTCDRGICVADEEQLPPPQPPPPPEPLPPEPTHFYSNAITAWHHTPLFEVLPDEDFSAAPVAVQQNPTAITLRAAPDEFKPFTISLKANQQRNDVTATITNLEKGNHIIPASNVDIRVAKVWEQRGRENIANVETVNNEDVNVPITIPELLVYDDSEAYTNGWDPTGGFVPGQIGKAFYSDVDLAEVPLPIPQLDEFTIDVLYKPLYDGTNDDAHRVVLNWQLPGGTWLEIISSKDTGQLVAVFKHGAHWMSCNIIDDDVLQNDQWTRITFVWDGIKLNYYIDGTEVRETVPGRPIGWCLEENIATHPITAGDSMLYIGDRLTGAWPAEGAIDDIHIFKYAATAPQVSRRMQNNGYDTAEQILHLPLNSAYKINQLGGRVHSSRYNQPSVSTTLRTDIPQGTAKTFWATINIPDNQPAGTYEGTLTLTSTQEKLADIPIRVQVLPFRLEEPEESFIVYYYSLWPQDEENTGQYIQEDLQDIRNHGFNGLRTSTAIFSPTEKSMVQFISEAGFEGPIVASGCEWYASACDMPGQINELQQYGYEPWIYGVDEPHKDLDEGGLMAKHIRKSYDIHEQGGKVFVAIAKESADWLEEENNEKDYYGLRDPKTQIVFKQITQPKRMVTQKLDGAAYSADLFGLIEWQSRWPGLIEYVGDLQNNRVQKNDRVEYMYYQSWLEKPLWSRTMTGFWFSTTQFDGVAAFPYARSFAYAGFYDPYNDFDNYKCNRFGNWCDSRDMQTIYPSIQGPIPTTKWEATREGIDDLRYLTTLNKFLDQKEARNPSLVAQIRAELQTRMQQFMDPGSLYYPDEPQTLTEDDFNEMRDWIIDQILILQSLE